MKITSAEAQLQERIKELTDMGFYMLPDGDYFNDNLYYLVTRRLIDYAYADEWDDELALIDHALNK